jgi:hypothetical protein
MNIAKMNVAGVIIENKLTFDQQISEKVNKTNSLEYKDCTTFLLLYTSLFYANQVWNPYLKKHIEFKENVQRRVSKQILGLSQLTHEEHLGNDHLT